MTLQKHNILNLIIGVESRVSQVDLVWSIMLIISAVKIVVFYLGLGLRQKSFVVLVLLFQTLNFQNKFSQNLSLGFHLLLGVSLSALTFSSLMS